MNLEQNEDSETPMITRFVVDLLKGKIECVRCLSQKMECELPIEEKEVAVDFQEQRKTVKTLLERKRIAIELFENRLGRSWDDNYFSLIQNNLQSCEFFAPYFFISFFIQKNHFPMLLDLELRRYLYGEREERRDVLRLSSKSNVSIDEIAVKLGLGRNRVKQILQNAYRRLKKYFLSDHKYEEYTYLLDIFGEADCICIESVDFQNHLKKSLKEERCCLSLEFVQSLIPIIFQNIYTKVPNKGNYLPYTILVKKEYAKIFNFEDLVLHVYNLLKTSRSVDEWFDIKDFMKKSRTLWGTYTTKRDMKNVLIEDNIDKIAYIVKEILLLEFDLTYKDDDSQMVVLPANTERNPSDVVYEILRQRGHPMHLDEIFVKFKEILPNHKYVEAEKLRHIVHKHPDIIPHNRKSVFKLKEWTHIKSGTIRSMVIDFLNERETPQMLDDIMEFLLQHFPDTNVSSVKVSMVNDEQKRFSFFRGGLVGLTHKEYSSQYKELEMHEWKKIPFEKRLHNVKIFIEENKRFPSTLGDKDERTLYAWWKRAIDGKLQINKEQQAQIESINTGYAEYKRVKRKKIEVQLFPKEHRKLNLCVDEINKISESHSETVQLLSRVLEDDEITNLASSNSEQQSNGFSSLHLELLDMFIKNNYSLSKLQVEDFAKSNRVMISRLIEQINEICYDILDDIIIEEDDEYWMISEDYLKAITNNER